MKTIESKIAPNPKEAQIWVDLSKDPHGTVRKIWNGKKWIEKDDQNNSEHVDEQINSLKKALNTLFQEFDKKIDILNKKIGSLTSRVKELERLIVTE